MTKLFFNFSSSFSPLHFEPIILNAIEVAPNTPVILFTVVDIRPTAPKAAADHGHFQTNAPNNIPADQSGNFQIIDTSGAAYGSEGHVTYNVDGLNANVELIFGCPYSDNNYAQYKCSNNDAITVRFRGTNGGNPEGSDWGSFPLEGHPLSLEYEIIHID